MVEERFGAYGLVPSGPVETRWWNCAPLHWVAWDFTWRELSEGQQQPRVDVDTMVIPHQPDGFAVIDRDMARTTLHLRAPLTEAGLVHPYVGSTVVARAFWERWHYFHAGSVVLDGAVWAFLGERGHGKSSAIAWLAGRGFPVFADDVLVIRGNTALAGPRSLDLRLPAAKHFGLGTHIGLVGTRERWRHHLDPVPPELGLGGFVSLEWHPEVEVEAVGLADRLRILARSASLVAPGMETAWLDLIVLPMLVLRRPRTWHLMDEAMAALLRAITESEGLDAGPDRVQRPEIPGDSQS